MRHTTRHVVPSAPHRCTFGVRPSRTGLRSACRRRSSAVARPPMAAEVTLRQRPRPRSGRHRRVGYDGGRTMAYPGGSQQGCAHCRGAPPVGGVGVTRCPPPPHVESPASDSQGGRRLFAEAAVAVVAAKRRLGIARGVDVFVLPLRRLPAGLRSCAPCCSWLAPRVQVPRLLPPPAAPARRTEAEPSRPRLAHMETLGANRLAPPRVCADLAPKRGQTWLWSHGIRRASAQCVAIIPSLPPMVSGAAKGSGLTARRWQSALQGVGTRFATHGFLDRDCGKQDFFRSTS